MDTNHDFKELIKKVEEMKRSGTVDLSTEEDLSLAVMNLVSLEEHFFFTASKTGKPEYFNFLDDIRSMRKALLGRLIDKREHEGETWCITKHLLGATMRLIEVGTKLHADGKTKEAEETYEHAYRLYGIFWGLRLKLLSVKDVKQIAGEEKPWTLKDIMGKLVACCDE